MSHAMLAGGMNPDDASRVSAAVGELFQKYARGGVEGAMAVFAQIMGVAVGLVYTAAVGGRGGGSAFDTPACAPPDYDRDKLPDTTEEVTPQEAADYLDISRPLVMRMIHTGVLPHRKVGTHYRIRFADVARCRDESYRRAAADCDEVDRLAASEEIILRPHHPGGRGG